MANTKSARKRVQVAARNNARNRTGRSAVRTRIKAFRAAVDAKDPNAPALLKEIHALLDHSADTGLLHRSTTSRYKSRLTLALNRNAARG